MLDYFSSPQAAASITPTFSSNMSAPQTYSPGIGSSLSVAPQMPNTQQAYSPSSFQNQLQTALPVSYQAPAPSFIDRLGSFASDVVNNNPHVRKATALYNFGSNLLDSFSSGGEDTVLPQYQESAPLYSQNYQPSQYSGEQAIGYKDNSQGSHQIGIGTVLSFLGA